MSRVVEMKTHGWPDVHGRILNVVCLLGHGYVGPLASCTYICTTPVRAKRLTAHVTRNRDRPTGHRRTDILLDFSPKLDRFLCGLSREA